MMNLRNRILITLFALGTILGGCDSLIFDDLEDCPQGVYVKFYSMTPCDVDSTFIGEVPSLTVFAFDENDKLATSVTQQKVTLSRDYELLVPVSEGNYSFVAWAGLNDNFTSGAFTPGVTTRKDVVLTLKSANNIAANLGSTRVWHGESPVISLPNPKENGSVYKHTAINLKELTNRVKVIVEIESSVKDIVPQDLAVSVGSANGTVHIDGSMPLKLPQLTYPLLHADYTDTSVAWNFALLDLVTGYHNNLAITYTKTGEKVFDGDLIASILLNTVDGGINLACENDFTVKFVMKDYCAECGTHFSCAIYVNDWLVHSYSTEL